MTIADRTLAVTVHVHVDGETHIFEAGCVPPGWACEQISNPDVWNDVDGSGSGTEQASPVDITSDPDGDVGGVPPRHGAGSGRDAWAAYAAANGVAVDEDMSRADIIDAVEAAGVATD